MKALLAAGLSLAVAATLGLGAPASAADGPEVARVSSPAQDAAARYWTPERMRAARPADDLLRRTAQVLRTTASGGLLGGLLGGLVGGGSDRGSLYTGGGTVVRTTGRVFFTLDKRDYACSGSSVRAKNKNLVQTAGHCVNAGPGAYATNVVFVPGYRDGKAPYGRWTASRLAVPKQWRTLGDLSYDVGYIRVKPRKKKSLAATVGAQGIAFNLPRGDDVDVFGYPASSPYDGRRLATCRGRLVDDRRGSSDQGVVCNLTGGASGGPWLADLDEKGAGVITSVSSFRYINLLSESRQLYGPYFGTVVQQLYNAAQK